MTPTVSIYTPFRKGGPWFAGEQLATALQETGRWRADHYHSLPALAASLVWPAGNVTISVNPIQFHRPGQHLLLWIHGNLAQELQNPLSRLYARSIRIADQIVVPSQYLKRVLQLEQAIVIPNAVPIPSRPASIRTRPHEFRILTVTKFLFPEKSQGVFTLTKILNGLPMELRQQIRLTVLGDGPYRPKIERAVRSLGITVVFAGFQRPERYLMEADIFAYYSMHDNLPLAVLEAMAAGLPVVSNPVGALPDVITSGKTGELAETDNAYRAALTAFIHEPERRRDIGTAARQMVEEAYSWPAVTDSWCSLLDSLRGDQQ